MHFPVPVAERAAQGFSRTHAHVRVRARVRMRTRARTRFGSLAALALGVLAVAALAIAATPGSPDGDGIARAAISQPAASVPALGGRWFALGANVPYVSYRCDFGCG